MERLVETLLRVGLVRGSSMIQNLGETFGDEYQDQLVTVLISQLRKTNRGGK